MMTIATKMSRQVWEGAWGLEERRVQACGRVDEREGRHQSFDRENGWQGGHWTGSSNDCTAYVGVSAACSCCG